MDKVSIKPIRRSLRIVLIYAVVGALWILFSDRLLFALTSDPTTLTNVAILKGLGYVATTAGMLYWLIHRDLDAVRLAENALRESEEHYRTLFETTPVGLGVADESGNLLTFNHALLKPGGYGRHDLAQIKNLARLCANRDEGEAILATTRQQGFLHQREVQFKRKDNTTYTVLLSLTPIQMKNQLGWQVVIEDITQRKLAEEILRESEERLKLVLEGSNDGFWDWTVTTGVVQFSLRWAEMLGYRLEEIEPHVRTWERLIHPDDQPAVMQALDDHLEGRTPQYETEHRLLTQSGEWKWISDRGKVVTRDEHGQPLRMTGMHTDITERRRADEALRDSEERFRSLVQNSSDVITIHDVHGTVLYETPSAAHILGYGPGGLIGKNPFEFISLDDIADSRAAFEEVVRRLNTGTPTEFRFRRADGSWIYLEAIASNLLDHPGIQGIVITSREITERKRAEEEARRRLREMALLNRVIATTATTLDERTALQTACEELGRAFEVSHCAAGLLTADGSQVTIVAEYRLPTRLSVMGVTFPVKGAAAEYILKHPQPLAIADAQADPRFSFIAPLLAQQGDVSLLVVPILMREQAIGAIALITTEHREFGEEEIALAQSVAGATGPALENAQLFQAEREQRELAQTLSEVGAALVSTLDMDSVLDRLLEQVSRVVPNDVANVMLIEDDQVRITRWRGYDRFGIEAVSTEAHPIADIPNLRQMIETGQPIIVTDTQADPNWLRRSEVGWRSYVGAPVRVQGRVIGFLNVSSATPGFFTPTHAERLRAFADHAAIAWQNAQLYRQLSEHAAALQL
jgi:PAS domain S-box-containing protein